MLFELFSITLRLFMILAFISLYVFLQLVVFLMLRPCLFLSLAPSTMLSVACVCGRLCVGMLVFLVVASVGRFFLSFCNLLVLVFF